MRTFRKVFSVLLAALLAFNSMSIRHLSVVRAEGRETKVEFTVSSQLSDNSTTTVVGRVYDDYSAVLTLPNAEVNGSNATATLTMTNIQSLGITGTRSISYPLTTDINRQMNIYDLMKLVG